MPYGRSRDWTRTSNRPIARQAIPLGPGAVWPRPATRSCAGPAVPIYGPCIRPICGRTGKSARIDWETDSANCTARRPTATWVDAATAFRTKRSARTERSASALPSDLGHANRGHRGPRQAPQRERRSRTWMRCNGISQPSSSCDERATWQGQPRLVMVARGHRREWAT